MIAEAVGGAIAAVILAACLFELALLLLIARRAGGTVSGGFLIGSIATHFLIVAPQAIDGLLSALNLPDMASVDLRPGDDAATLWNLMGEVVLPALLVLAAAFDVGFALTYPRLLGPVARRPWNLAWLALPPLAMAAWGTRLTIMTWERGAFLGLEEDMFFSVALILVALATVAYLVLFRHRTRHGPTELERRRGRFMMKAVGVPMLLVIVMIGVLVLTDVVLRSLGVADDTRLFVVNGALGVPTMAVYALIPPTAIGLGVLHYRIIDWDRKMRGTLRATVGGGVITGAFLVTYFLVSEAVAFLIQDRTGSVIAGLAAAAAFALVNPPLHRAAGRVARRIVPEPDQATRRIRRKEIYRAAYEDLTADGRLDAEERASLQAFAATLGINPAEVLEIEGFVEKERPRPRIHQARAVATRP